jgi:phosphate transport system permease protein
MSDGEAPTVRAARRGTSLRRRLVNRAVTIFCVVAVLLALAPLLHILGYVVGQGLPAMTGAFFTSLPKPVGEIGGGMANAIVGTLILIVLAGSIAVPLGIVAGVFLAEYARSRLATAVRLSADVLNGVPSIVVGIFAYTIVVLPMKRFSALAGGVALSIIMIPLIVRTTEELLRLVPPTLRDGALALGATRARAVWTVILPAAFPGLVTGILVALARVGGETAPLLFTAFNSRYWSFDLRQPIASLTVQVYTYAISPYDDWHRQAWAGAAILIATVLCFSLLARLATRRLVRMGRV